MVKDHIGGTEGVVTLGLTTFVIGIAIGSGLAARASHGKPNLALVPLGAVLMGVFALALGGLAAMMSPGAATDWRQRRCSRPAPGIAVIAALCGLAIAGGLYIVPAFAAVQVWSPPERRARVIAAVNVMNAAYMVAGGAIVAGLQAAGVGVGAIFCRARPAQHRCRGVRGACLGLEPDPRSRAADLRLFFHLEVKGLENLEGAGDRVVIAPNHVEPARRTATAHYPAQGGIVRRQLADRHGVVGEAVPQGDQCVSAGADAPAGGAHAGQCGQSRRDDRDFPGGTHHRHRVHHEGVRRHRHDCRQGGRGHCAGAHRRPRALVLELPQAVANPQGAVSEVHGDVPAAAPAGSRPRAQGQAAAAGGRPRAAGHHGRGGRRRRRRSTARCSRPWPTRTRPAISAGRRSPIRWELRSATASSSWRRRCWAPSSRRSQRQAARWA